MGLNVQRAYAPTKTQVLVSNEMLQMVLRPYKPHCRYLNAAFVERDESGSNLLSARGEFSIAESCYIADTGHFNAVEFNICYNQLTYCLLAQCIQDGLLAALDSWSIVDYKRRQLSAFLIVEFSSWFRKPINARSFEGQVEIVKVAIRKQSVFIKTTCSFQDSTGGFSKGEALIVVLGESVTEKTEDASGMPAGREDGRRLRELLGGMLPKVRSRSVAAFLRETISDLLSIDPAEIGPRDNLLERGIDSLKAVELKVMLGSQLGLELGSSLLFDYPTIESLAGFLLAEMGLGGGPVAPMVDRIEPPEGGGQEEMSDLLVAALEKLSSST